MKLFPNVLFLLVVYPPNIVFTVDNNNTEDGATDKSNTKTKYHNSSIGGHVGHKKKKYCYSSKDTRVMMEKLMNNSENVHTIPSFDDGTPLEIKLDLTVLAFRDIKEVDMTYTVDFFLRTKWTDNRLKNSLDCVFTMTMGKKHPAQVIWVPDTMIENSVTSYLHEVLTNNHKIDISPNGDVFWSTRVTANAMCHMDLRKYPRDKQMCSLVLLSYTYPTELLKFVWDESYSVSVMDKELSEFDVTSFERKSYNFLYAAGEYSILEAKFVFERRIGHYLIQLYIPCAFLVTLAGLSFWVNHRAIPARIALSLTTLLTITTIWSAANSNMPPVSYAKAIDVYFLVSFGFVFITLLEYIIVLSYPSMKKTAADILRLETKAVACGCLRMKRDNPAGEVIDNHSLVLVQTTDNCELHSVSQRYEKTEKANNCSKKDVTMNCENDESSIIDRITKILYPTSYIVFNIVYWCQLNSG